MVTGSYFRLGYYYYIISTIRELEKSKLSPGREVDGVKEVGVFLFFWQFVKWVQRQEGDRDPIQTHQVWRGFEKNSVQVSYTVTVFCVLNIKTGFRRMGSDPPYIQVPIYTSLMYTHICIKTHWNKKLCNIIKHKLPARVQSHLPLMVTGFRSASVDGSSASDWEAVGQPRLLDRDRNNSCTFAKEISWAVCGCEERTIQTLICSSAHAQLTATVR